MILEVRILKRLIAFLLVGLMLSGCGAAKPAPTPEPTVETVATPEPTPAPTPTHVGSTLRLSDALEGRTVTAEAKVRDREWGTWEQFLYSEEPLSELLISMVEWHKSEDNEIVFQEREILLYLPELAAGEAIRLVSEMPEVVPYLQIGYLTAAGDYEVVQLGYNYNDRDGGGILIPTEPQVMGRLYLGEGEDGGAPTSYTWASEETIALLESGALADYVPMGLTVFDGAVADINCDGIEDVALVLMSDGNLPAQYYCSNLPMYILLGKAGGGYEIAQKFASGLFMPYRSDCRIEAGEGYIEFYYYLVGGAVPHHTAVFRFEYDGAGDWILSEYGYTFTPHPNNMANMPDIISTPDYLRRPISTFSIWKVLENVQTWQDTAQGEMKVSVPYRDTEETVTASVRPTDGGFEGVIFHHWYDSPSVICTIADDLPAGAELVVQVNQEAQTFTIGEDVWSWYEECETFFKNLK